MRRAWILPRANQSTLFRSAEQAYRGGADRPVEVGPVPMPPLAVHVLDVEADTLVYADGGALGVVRGILAERSICRVKVPGKPKIHALALLDGVVYAGGDGGALGLVDLRGELRWQRVDVPKNVIWPGKGIDGFAMHERRLVAVDDIVMPRYLLVYDVADPRAPRLLEARDLPAHSSYERVISVASAGATMALLSTSANHGHMAAHVALMDLATLEEWAVLHAEAAGSFRRHQERQVDFRAVALAGDLVLIAAGADGLGVLRVPPRPAGGPRPTPRFGGADRKIPLSDVRFVPVGEERVTGVVPVDEALAFAIVERRAGLLKRSALDAVLVSIGA